MAVGTKQANGTSAPAAGGTPVHTIAGLARIAWPTQASQVNYLLRSVDATCQALAMVIHQHAHDLQAVLSWPPAGAGVVDRARLRRNAKQVRKQLDQAADRVEAAGASARATWRVYSRAFAEHRAPPKGQRKTFDHRR